MVKMVLQRRTKKVNENDIDKDDGDHVNNDVDARINLF